MRAAMLVVLALAGCRGSGETTVPRSRPVRAVKADKPAEAWVFSFTPGPWVMGFGRVRSGRLHQVNGRMRLAWADGEKRVADDIPAETFSEFDSSDAGFVFLTNDGAMYRADSFVGALRYVPGYVGGYVDVAALGGTAFACTRDGKLAMGDVGGDGPMKRRAEACLSVRSSDTDVVVSTYRGLLRWTEESRSFTPYEPGRPRPPKGGSGMLKDWQAKRDELWKAWKERYGPLSAAARAYRTPDGHFFSEHDGLSHLDGRPIPMVLGADCRLFTPDSHVTALCRAQHPVMREGYSVYRLEQGRWKQKFRLPDAEEDYRYGSGDNLVIGSDGSMVEARACKGEDEEEDEEDAYAYRRDRRRERPYYGKGKGDRYDPYDRYDRDERDETPKAHLCWFDGTDYRTVVYESPRIHDAEEEAEEEEGEDELYGYPYGRDDESVQIEPRGIHRQWALLWDDDENEYRLLNLRSGGSGRRLDYSMFGGVVGRPYFIGNALRTTLTTDEGLLVVDVRDGQTVLMAVPEEAVSVGFASRDRGLAVGSHLDEVWTTVDGGETWTPHEIEVDGDPAAVKLRRVRCTNSACAAEPLVWMTPEVRSKIDAEPPRLVAPTTALERRRRWRR